MTWVENRQLSGELLLAPTNLQGVIFRLAIALLAGAIVGLEREVKEKAAGLRTHMLVSFGSAFFVLATIQVGAVQDSPDVLSRVIQGITTGIGFLGAGQILHESRPGLNKGRIRGLTSAAAIWVSAAIGIAAGCGLWSMSLIGSVICLIVLTVFKYLELFS